MIGSGEATARWVTGDCMEIMKQLPDASVDLIITSPPFLALRSYLPADDQAKAQEIGQESTPGEFLDVLLDLVVEWRRILTPHGSLCVELGDTYAGSGGAGGDYLPGGLRDGQEPFDGSASKWDRSSGRKAPGGQPYTDTFKNGGPGGEGWPLPKSLCLIPQLFAVSLSYGRNPLTGRTLEPWRVRNVVRWCRPNPPVGALGDKFRPATSEMLIACTGNKRWFDLDAVRTPAQQPEPAGDRSDRRTRVEMSKDGSGDPGPHGSHPAGAPPLDFWVIPTHPYKGSHYATFPPALVVKPVEAMCPRQVCTVCGQPSTRITSEPSYVNDDGSDRSELDEPWRHGRFGLKGDHLSKAGHLTRHAETLGWSDCGHDAWRAGRVLDPFGGSGTTLEVAIGKGRDAIGVDLDRRNVELARQRVGPFFFEEQTVDELVSFLNGG